MTTETVPPQRRLRVVVAISIVVSLVCIGWWGVQLQWFAQEPDTSQHVVAFDPHVVTLGDGAHARIGLAVVVVGEDGVAPVEAAGDRVQIVLVEQALERDAAGLRSGDGQDRLRGELLRALREVVHEATIERVLLTEVLVQ